MRDTATPEVTTDSVGQAAAKALLIAHGDASKAIPLMAERVRSDGDLRKALLDPLVEYACGQAIHLAIRSKRSDLWSQPIKAATISPQERAIALSRQNLLLFPLPGGKALGSATAEDLDVASDFYGKQAADMSHKHKWLKLIRSSLPHKKTVSQVFDEAKLRDLQQEAARG